MANETVDARAFLSQRFSGEGLERAIAVMMAESGGDAHNQGRNGDGSIDRGLFQINSHWHSEVKDNCAYDASCNAQAAKRISKNGADWHEWSTWNSGAYRKFYKDGQRHLIHLHRPAGSLPTTGLPDLAGGIPNPLDALSKPIELAKSIWDTLTNPNLYLRAGKAVLGAFLIWMGLVFIAYQLLAKGAKTGGKVAGTAASASGAIKTAAKVIK